MSRKWTDEEKEYQKYLNSDEEKKYEYRCDWRRTKLQKLINSADLEISRRISSAKNYINNYAEYSEQTRFKDLAKLKELEDLYKIQEEASDFISNKISEALPEDSEYKHIPKYLDLDNFDDHDEYEEYNKERDRIISRFRLKYLDKIVEQYPKEYTLMEDYPKTFIKISELKESISKRDKFKDLDHYNKCKDTIKQNNSFLAKLVEDERIADNWDGKLPQPKLNLKYSWNNNGEVEFTLNI